MRASGRLIEKASLSLMLTSGYCVCWKAFSSACSCDTVKAVRLRRCFCWLPYRASRMSSDRKHKQCHHQLVQGGILSGVVEASGFTFVPHNKHILVFKSPDFPFCAEFSRSPCVRAGSLWLLQLPPTVQRHS